jgi:predicted transcriptional regulator
MKNVHNFHVPLPSDVYARLRKEAKRDKKPVTALAREAIHQWLEHRKREILHDAISSYATDFAGSDVDLDEQLEEAATELLIEDD